MPWGTFKTFLFCMEHALSAALCARTHRISVEFLDVYLDLYCVAINVCAHVSNLSFCVDSSSLLLSSILLSQSDYKSYDVKAFLSSCLFFGSLKLYYYWAAFSAAATNVSLSVLDEEKELLLEELLEDTVIVILIHNWCQLNLRQNHLWRIFKERISGKYCHKGTFLWIIPFDKNTRRRCWVVMELVWQKVSKGYYNIATCVAFAAYWSWRHSSTALTLAELTSTYNIVVC